MKKRLIIKSDGTSIGTKVLDIYGNSIGLIEKIIWEVSVEDKISKCTIHCINFPLEAVVDAEIKSRKPLSKKARKQREPLKPEELVGACQDTVHKEIGKTRIAKTTRIKNE